MLTLTEDGKYVEFQGSKWAVTPYVSLSKVQELLSKLNCPRFLKQVQSGQLWIWERSEAKGCYVNFATWEFDEELVRL